ncbi:PX domain containing 1a [Misgurnus anguillicaudatus]|uniref:PX domain containing 1a n=1 Tax=Misgurnus anguillicaudatus TaxID=75329 RepID=UPI003CCF03BF
MAGVTSLSVRKVTDCCVIGLEHFAVGEEEFFQIRTEWSDKSIRYLRRRYLDLVKLATSLEKLFSEDSGSLTQSLTLKALQKIIDAEQPCDIENKLDEVETLLKTIIKMPPKYSQCKAVLTFFKTTPLDYTLKNMFDPIQPFYQSPVTVADVRRANGFCLANTETVLFDPYMLEKGVKPSKSCISETEAQIWTGTTCENGIRPDKEFVHTPYFMSSVLTTVATENKEDDYHPKKTEFTTNNITSLHLHACETDILE